MPVHIKRYYSELGINSLTNFVSIAFSAYGPGWTMNYCRWLEYNNLMGDGRETILYLNEKGNAVYFEKTDEIKDGKRKWREMHFEYIGDTGCTLWMPTSVESAVADNYDKITIEESNGQILKFNSNGALKEIVSAKNSSDKITITHTGRGYDIDTITDGVGRKYVFSYYNDGDITSPTVLTSIQAFNADGTPVKVKDADGNDVDYKITYNGTDKPTSREFISATYPDGKTVSYSTNGDTKYIRNINKYYYDSESGYYYVQTRYYDPEICRYINAAEGGDAVPQAKAPAKYAHANRFLFNANNPQTCSMVPITPDVSGTGSSSNITYETSFDSSYISRLIKVLVFGYTLTYYEDAFTIVYDSDSQKGIIQIDLEKTGECENTLSDIIYEFSDCMGEDVFLAMAVYATKYFEDNFARIYNKIFKTDTMSKREFLFSDECVANEIKQHVLGYWRSVGKDAPLTVTVAGMYVYTWIYSQNGSLYERCKVIDIAEQDVISDSNRIAFDYFNGIRDCYFGKPADPFYYYNEGRKSTPRADWLVNKIPV